MGLEYGYDQVWLITFIVLFVFIVPVSFGQCGEVGGDQAELCWRVGTDLQVHDAFWFTLAHFEQLFVHLVRILTSDLFKAGDRLAIRAVTLKALRR